MTVVPTSPGNASGLPKRTYGDSEIIYWPHWQFFDGSNNKKPLLNTADGIFPKPVVEPLAIGIYHIYVYNNSYSDALYKEQLNATNSDTWKTWAPGQAWISRIVWKTAQVNGGQTTEVHYVVRCNEFGWNTTIPNMGYAYKSGTAKIPFQESIGLLKSDGTQATTLADVSISNKQIKRRIPFTPLLGA